MYSTGLGSRFYSKSLTNDAPHIKLISNRHSISKQLLAVAGVLLSFHFPPGLHGHVPDGRQWGRVQGGPVLNLLTPHETSPSSSLSFFFWWAIWWAMAVQLPHLQPALSKRSFNALQPTSTTDSCRDRPLPIFRTQQRTDVRTSGTGSNSF